jgi:hypothetical protein
MIHYKTLSNKTTCCDRSASTEREGKERGSKKAKAEKDTSGSGKAGKRTRDDEAAPAGSRRRRSDGEKEGISSVGQPADAPSKHRRKIDRK